jgi:hypothetical protein
MAGLAVEATKQALYYYGPSILTQEYWETAKKPKAGWMSRLQAAAGPHKTSSSDPHVGGRALDIILFAKKPDEKYYADSIVQVFLGLKAKLKFISIVYNLQEWNSAGSRFPHIDEAHKTHIHIEWSKTTVGSAGFQSDLEDALYAEFSGGNFESGDYAAG